MKRITSNEHGCGGGGCSGEWKENESGMKTESVKICHLLFFRMRISNEILCFNVQLIKYVRLM